MSASECVVGQWSNRGAPPPPGILKLKPGLYVYIDSAYGSGCVSPHSCIPDHHRRGVAVAREGQLLPHISATDSTAHFPNGDRIEFSWS